MTWEIRLGETNWGLVLTKHLALFLSRFETLVIAQIKIIILLIFKCNQSIHTYF